MSSVCIEVCVCVGGGRGADVGQFMGRGANVRQSILGYSRFQPNLLSDLPVLYEQKHKTELIFLVPLCIKKL